MNALAQDVLVVAKGYLGPAAQKFLSAEMQSLGVNANTVTGADLKALSESVRGHAVRLMGVEKAGQLADAIAGCARHAPKAPHKLATDAAQKLLEQGKLRQAEKAFLDLVAKHGDVHSYIGLARAQITLDDPAAALNTLREGAAKFARAGDRGTAVSLLAEAVQLVPEDLAAHRRLAAALANQGDMTGAVEEYARFVDVALNAGDSRRALLELAYGRETLGDLPGLTVLVDKVTGVHTRNDAPRPAARKASLVFYPPAVSSTPTPVPPPPTSTLRAERTREAPPAPSITKTVETKTAEPMPTPKVEVELDPRLAALASLTPAPKTEPAPAAKLDPKAAAKQQATAAKEAKAQAKVEQKQAPRTRPDASHTAVVLKDARTITHADHSDLETPVDVLARAGVVKRLAPKPVLHTMSLEQQLSALPAMGSGIDGAAVAASRAAMLTSAKDTRATEAVMDAARRLMALGKLQSASDVLLDYIAHGFTDREAQRLLIEVNCSLDRRDVAKEKCDLLSRAYRLDGRVDVADDVERLARIL